MHIWMTKLLKPQRSDYYERVMVKLRWEGEGCDWDGAQRRFLE